MTLNELRYVVAVAHERNFRRAAERCFITQPALSLAIQKLEDELGVALFERKTNDVTSTTVGALVVEQAARVLDEVSKIRNIVEQGLDQLTGVFRLGVIHTVGPYLLPDLIHILSQLAPNMPLEVEENTTANLELQICQGGLDAVIVALPFDRPGMKQISLYDEAFVVVVPSDHPWAGNDYIDAAALSKEKVLLLNSGHCFSNQVVEACPQLSRKSEVFQGNSLETIRNMVASGLGITVLPCSAVSERYYNPLLKVVPFHPPAPARRIALVSRKSFVRNEAISVLAEAVRAIQSDCLQEIVS